MMQQQSDMATWIQFFKDASIPPQFASSYAAKFTQNRIRFDMLGDIDKNLLNEMGINAIGDVLSILKHAKIINSKVLEKKNSMQGGLKNRCDVAKRIIETYLGETDLKSSNLTTRVTFNEDSLNKVIVSSTTNSDDDFNFKNLKRKFANDIDEDDDYVDQNYDDEKPLEYRGYLKQSPTKVIKLNKSSTRVSMPPLTFNELSKLQNKPVKSRLSMNNSFADTPTTSTTSKIIKLNKSTSDLTMTANMATGLDSIKKTIINNSFAIRDHQPEYLFKRIGNTNESSADKIMNQLSLIKKSIENKNVNTNTTNKTKIIPITFDKMTSTNTKSVTTNSTNSKIISLNNNKSNTKTNLYERIKFS